MAASSAPEPKVLVALNVNIPKSLDDRLERFCFERRHQKLTKRAFVEMAIREKLDRDEDQTERLIEGQVNTPHNNTPPQGVK